MLISSPYTNIYSMLHVFFFVGRGIDGLCVWGRNYYIHASRNRKPYSFDFCKARVYRNQHNILGVRELGISLEITTKAFPDYHGIASLFKSLASVSSSWSERKRFLWKILIRAGSNYTKLPTISRCSKNVCTRWGEYFRVRAGSVFFRHTFKKKNPKRKKEP